MWKARVDCNNCGKKGHIAWRCPEGKGATKEEPLHAKFQEDGSDEDNIEQGKIKFVQKIERGGVNKNWLLVDSQSMVDQIANPALLKNIRKEDSMMTVHCNAGSTSTKLERDLGRMTVKHRNCHSIANMLSLHEDKQPHRVTYDSWDRIRVFQVHTEDGIVEFMPSSRLSHFHDVSDPSSNMELMRINTVSDNFERYL